MKRVLKPAGQLLMTAALSSIALDYIAPVAIANPTSDPLTLSEGSRSEADAQVTPTPAQASIAAPESTTMQEFSQPPQAQSTDNAASELPPLEPSEQLPQSASDETATSDPLATSPAASSPSIALPLSLSDRLATIVEQERPEREARLRDNLTKSALYYAHVGEFGQARRTAQNPALSAESQAGLLAQIDALEGQISAANASERPDMASSETTTPTPLTVRDQIPVDYLQRFQAAPAQICKTEIDQIATPLLTMQRQYPDMLYSLVERSQQYRVQRNIAKCVAASPTAIAFNDQPLLMQAVQGLTMTYPLTLLAEITSRFGWRIHPITGDRRFHAGVDLGAPYGTPVLAALTGRVVSADFMNGYGLTIVLEHNNSSQRTLYAHLSGIAVEPGTQIEQGHVIGWVGSTGNSTGPHLHFEVQTPTTEGWVAVDPMPPQNAVIANR
ncbi:MAG: peptidoglycan DD-metalloendopeptidase family protein [Oculatellaceae cyanobacterium bins.114]|nr:peptidoglycan DD-metalloendopeptidase family protein [Oculatellaceae cyanobacterium bins.114]